MPTYCRTISGARLQRWCIAGPCRCPRSRRWSRSPLPTPIHASSCRSCASPDSARRQRPTTRWRYPPVCPMEFRPSRSTLKHGACSFRRWPVAPGLPWPSRRRCAMTSPAKAHCAPRCPCLSWCPFCCCWSGCWSARCSSRSGNWPERWTNARNTTSVPSNKRACPPRSCRSWWPSTDYCCAWRARSRGSGDSSPMRHMNCVRR